MKYSQTSLIRTPKGQNQVSALQRCPYYKGREHMIFGISVHKREVFIREVRLQIGRSRSVPQQSIAVCISTDFLGVCWFIVAGYLKKSYLKADLGGTINTFSYDYRVQLTHVMTFNHTHEHNFLLTTSTCVKQMSWV